MIINNLYDHAKSQSLLEELVARDDRIKNKMPAKPLAKPLKAKKNASLDDFVAMVAKVVARTFKNQNVVFIPDEGAIISDPKEKLENPTILYQVVSREPYKELKPRLIENIVEEIDDKKNRRFGSNWQYRQECVIQFDVVACDYATANKVMSTFEDTIFTYTGYFKQQGVTELYLKKYYTDKNLDKYRQWLSVRSVQYSVVVEKIITVFENTIEDIDVE